MNQILTPADLQKFMENHEIPGEIIYMDVLTPTVEAAAEAVGTLPSRIVKSVLFHIQDSHILAIATGTHRIDRRSIAVHFGVGRKQVKLSSPETVQSITGYPVGTVPPFGHLTPLSTLIDQDLLKMDVIYAGGGAHNALVRLNPQDILRVSNGHILDLHN